MTSFATLHNAFTLDDLISIDTGRERPLKGQAGLTTTDASELLHVRTHFLGWCLRTFATSHLTSIARELEYLLNDTTKAGMSARVRSYRAQQPNVPSSKQLHSSHDHANSKLWNLPARPCWVRIFKSHA